MKKAIIYRRASTNETKQAHSLDNQARMLWSFAEEYGYEVIEEVVEAAVKKVVEEIVEEAAAAEVAPVIGHSLEPLRTF